jgi:ABC-type polysaccharide/polyol phosphate transport system ATPase subunit
MTDFAIRLSNINKSFGNYSIKKLFFNACHYGNSNPVLIDIDLAVHPGEKIALIGQNGAGKTTLLSLISGELLQSSGSIDRNVEVTNLSNIFGFFSSNRTPEENVKIYGFGIGESNLEIKRRLEWVSHFSDIGDSFHKKKYEQLSSGMKARVSFSNAIYQPRGFVLIDETLSVGDAKFQKKAFDYLDELFNSSGGCIIVSHSTEILKRICNRAILLDGGRIVGAGSVVEMETLYQDVLAHGSYARLIEVRSGVKKKPQTNQSSQFELINIIASRVNDSVPKMEIEISVKVLSGPFHLGWGWNISDKFGTMLVGQHNILLDLEAITVNAGQTLDLRVSFIDSFNQGAYFFSFGFHEKSSEGAVQIIARWPNCLQIDQNTKTSTEGLVNLMSQTKVVLDDKLVSDG